MIRKQLKKEFEKIQLPVPLEGQFKKVCSFAVHTPVYRIFLRLKQHSELAVFFLFAALNGKKIKCELLMQVS